MIYALDMEISARQKFGDRSARARIGPVSGGCAPSRRVGLWRPCRVLSASIFRKRRHLLPSTPRRRRPSSSLYTSVVTGGRSANSRPLVHCTLLRQRRRGCPPHPSATPLPLSTPIGVVPCSNAASHGNPFVFFTPHIFTNLSRYASLLNRHPFLVLFVSGLVCTVASAFAGWANYGAFNWNPEIVGDFR